MNTLIDFSTNNGATNYIAMSYYQFFLQTQRMSAEELAYFLSTNKDAAKIAAWIATAYKAAQ